MKVSYYNGVKDRIGIKTDISNILQRIKIGYYQPQIEYIRANSGDGKAKIALPGACFSGTFEERSDTKLISYSKLVVLDVDEKDYQKVIMAKTMLVQDPYVYCFFESPNRGLKILIKVQTGPELHRDVAFPQLKEYIEDNYGLEVDNSGKNVSRLCFTSSDPELYLNEESLVFEVDTTYKPAQFYKERAREKEYKNYQPSESLSFIYDKCVEWTDRNISFVKGDRNNYIFQLACLLNRAGMSRDNALHMIVSRLNPNMPYKEINTTVSGVYNRNRNEHATRVIYQEKNYQDTLF